MKKFESQLEKTVVEKQDVYEKKAKRLSKKMDLFEKEILGEPKKKKKSDIQNSNKKNNPPKKKTKKKKEQDKKPKISSKFNESENEKENKKKHTKTVETRQAKPETEISSENLPN